MSDVTIRRAARRTTWTVLDNAMIEDPRLGFDALGLLTYLLSKPDHWEVRARELQARGGIGRDAVRAVMRTLRDAGYARLVSVRGPGGRMVGRTWEISETIEGQADGRAPEMPSFGATEGRVGRPTVGPTDGQGVDIVSTETPASTEEATAPDTPLADARGGAAAGPGGPQGLVAGTPSRRAMDDLQGEPPHGQAPRGAKAPGQPDAGPTSQSGAAGWDGPWGPDGAPQWDEARDPDPAALLRFVAAKRAYLERCPPAPGSWDAGFLEILRAADHARPATTAPEAPARQKPERRKREAPQKGAQGPMVAAVAAAAGLSTAVMAETDRFNVAKLARDLLGLGMTPEDVQAGALAWRRDMEARLRGRPATPPSIAQLRSWLAGWFEARERRQYRRALLEYHQHWLSARWDRLASGDHAATDHASLTPWPVLVGTEEEAFRGAALERPDTWPPGLREAFIDACDEWGEAMVTGGNWPPLRWVVQAHAGVQPHRN